MITITSSTLKHTTFIDLMAGIGGAHIAFESVGSRCVFAVENDQKCRFHYFDKFGLMPAGDISSIDAKDIPLHDILAATLPFQSISETDKKLGLDVAKGTLFYDVIRIAMEHKPKVIFLETATKLTAAENAETFTTMQTLLEEQGYSIYFDMLNSADYGISQNRERAYIVCFRKDLNINSFQFPKTLDMVVRVEDILSADESEAEKLTYHGDDIHLVRDDDNQTVKKVKRLGYAGKTTAQGNRIFSAKGLSPTISPQTGGKFGPTGGYLIDGKIRKLSVRECARLFGFPDNFDLNFSISKSYKIIGDSVVVDVIQLIAVEIGKVINAAETTFVEYNGQLSFAI